MLTNAQLIERLRDTHSYTHIEKRRALDEIERRLLSATLELQLWAVGISPSQDRLSQLRQDADRDKPAAQIWAKR